MFYSFTNEQPLKGIVVFRTEGNNTVGLGHIIRCISLAKAIENNFTSIFITRAKNKEAIKIIIDEGFKCISLPLNLEEGIPEAHWVGNFAMQQKAIITLDGYEFDGQYQMACRSGGSPVVVLDDQAKNNFHADVVINHVIGYTENDFKLDKHSKVYLGPKYALIRKNFLVHIAQPVTSSISFNSAFVMMGGADPANITQKLVDLLAYLDLFGRIVVVTGASYSHRTSITKALQNNELFHLYHDITGSKLVQLMSQQDVACVPLSTALYEVFCIGMYTLTGYISETQKNIMNLIDDSKLAVTLGDLRSLSRDRLLEGIEKLRKVPEMPHQQKAAMNPNSLENLLHIYTEVWNQYQG